MEQEGTVINHVSIITRIPVLLLAAVLLFPTMIIAQPFQREIVPFEVQDSFGQPLINPFAGGLDLTRIGLIDLEGDNYPDLFVLNLGEQLRHYRNNGSIPFQLDTSSFWSALPMRSWFRFADLNGDNAADLFTSGERSELMMLRNQGTNPSPIFGQLDTVYQKDGSVIYTEQQTVPTFVDIDADGDLDLFSGNVDGTITFYENTGSPVDPAFEFQTSRFEGLLVISPARTEEEKGPSVQGGGKHGASVLDFVDLDGDDDLDMLFGDFFTATLLHFENRGSNKDPDFDTLWVDTAFAPRGDMVRSLGFNQAVSGDIDKDGDVDVVVSSLLSSATHDPIALYTNQSDSEVATLRQSTTDLTSEIDVGRHAAPVFLRDAERSGLLIGSEDGSITWYQEGRDNDRVFWKLSRRFILDGVTMSSPAVGDLDGDNVAEIIVGKADAIDGSTLRLYRFQGGELVRVPWMLDTSANVARSNASPTLADYDNDNDLDLFVGARNGRFFLFENTGTPTSPEFTVKTPPAPFDTLDLGSNSVPRFSDLNGDGAPDVLAIGAAISDLDFPFDTLRFWLNDGGSFREDPAWPMMLVPRSSVAIVDMVANHRYLVIGTEVGGLLAFRDTTQVFSSVETIQESNAASVHVSPMLFGDGEQVLSVRWNNLMSSGTAQELIIVDPLGREVLRVGLEEMQGEKRLLLPELPPGLFFWNVQGVAGGRFLVL